MNTSAAVIRKPRPTLYLLIVGSWIASNIAFHVDRHMWHVGARWMAYGPWLIAIQIGWLFAFHSFWITVLAAWYRRRYPEPPTEAPLPSAGAAPAVALLYLTCDDFSEAAAQSCLDQSYPSFRLYVLDDSVSPEAKARVDRFAAHHAGKVKVVRRPTRRGHKAGNLNDALAGSASSAPYFAVADADEILPPDFLARLMNAIEVHPRCGFVQANHMCIRDTGSSAFAGDLGIGIDIYWRWYHPLKNRYGFVPLLGHGALVRRACWQEIGGFPEVVSEDLAFATRARRLGWVGTFAEDVMCLEEFPTSPRRFRIRHMKWSLGTSEYLCREFPAFLASRNVTWVEKLDVLLPLLRFPMAIVSLVSVFQAMAMAERWKTASALIVPAAGSAWNNLGVVAMIESFGVVFFALSIFCVVAPLLCFAIDLTRRPHRFVRFACLSAVAYGGLGPLSGAGVAWYLATRRAEFFVTGSSADTRAARVAIHPDNKRLFAWEALCALTMAYLAAYTHSFAFLGMALACGLQPILHRMGWRGSGSGAFLLAVLRYLPLPLIAIDILLGAIWLIRRSG